jgi:hypothetical protein
VLVLQGTNAPFCGTTLMPNYKLAPAKSTGCRPPTAGNCRRSTLAADVPAILPKTEPGTAPE